MRILIVAFNLRCSIFRFCLKCKTEPYYSVCQSIVALKLNKIKLKLNEFIFREIKNSI